MIRKNVIFDTDPGVDDAMALLFLARSPLVRLIGITTSHGNGDIDTTTRNALFLAEWLGVDAEVYEGARHPLKGVATPPPTFIHGENALGDIAIPDVLGRRASSMPAHRFIIETVKARPHEISIVAVGRMTNLALALREAPEIAGLVKEVVVMGGAFGCHGHTGNVTPLAEANIIGDPLAADEVFGAVWPVTLVGLDVTQQTIMTREYLADIARSAGKDGEMIWDVSRGYEAFHRSSGVEDGIYVHDSSAVAYLLDPSLFDVVAGPVRVIEDGFAKGHTIRSKAGAWGERPSVQVCVGVDSIRLLDLYRNTLMQGITV
ncbi:nucleoside hydrolase [Paraburkholderia sp. D1E]|uniref:nucleoside hydrolase n=1 Tax=Paraburkholderia sp. D1E TaxID=3461398 RepID=UPI0040466A3A